SNFLSLSLPLVLRFVHKHHPPQPKPRNSRTQPSNHDPQNPPPRHSHPPGHLRPGHRVQRHHLHRGRRLRPQLRLLGLPLPGGGRVADDGGADDGAVPVRGRGRVRRRHRLVQPQRPGLRAAHLRLPGQQLLQRLRPAVGRHRVQQHPVDQLVRARLQRPVPVGGWDAESVICL
ncbi:hypothetical protein ASPACDRAFT_1890745, partial [Aspergillus aculeatus ATCC 16872]